MNRLRITGAAIAGTAGIAAVQAQDVEKRPNIIYIMSDDHAAQAVSAYGGILSTVMPTPNIDRLAAEGVRVDNCFVTNSISTPSRAAILTGQYSQNNGVYTLLDRLDPEAPNLAGELQSAGYKTAVIGKWHLGSEPSGFDYYNILPGQGVYHNPELIEKGTWNDSGQSEGHGAKGRRYEGHSTDIIASEAIGYMERVQDENGPFFLMCHFKAPHRPWQPAERFKNLLADVDIPEPANLLDTYEGKGQYTDEIRMSLENMNRVDLKTPPRTDISRDEFRHWAYQIYLKDYLRCIAGIDENVGRILDYLDQNGLSENTIVVYTSDQGFFLGEHGWFDKRLMFEESLRMPLLIRYPKTIHPGSVNGDIITNVDFAPTLLDFAGITVPGYMQGESFRPNVEGKSPRGWRKAMYYRYWMQGDGAHNATAHYGIRTNRYKLIFFYARALGRTGTTDSDLTPVWELYDLWNDPAEMNNIYNDPENARLVRKLKKQLLELKVQYGDEDSGHPEMKRIASQYYW